MNGEDLKFLADRAGAVRGRPDQRLAEVHARIRSARRRPAAGAVAGASALVLAILLGIALVTGPTGTDKDHEQIPPAESPTRTDATTVSTSRPLVYADGAWPMDKIHVGDQTVDISDPLPPPDNDDGEWGMVFLQVSGDGVLLLTHDGRIWFTDGD
jgi:hypothetical protein